MRKKLLLAAVGAFVLIAVGLGVGWFLVVGPAPSEGGIDTELKGVTAFRPSPLPPPEPAKPEKRAELPCWEAFGGGPLRSLSRPEIQLGVPGRSRWARGLRDLMEFPPVYCNGRLYVNLVDGKTVAVDADTGRVLWARPVTGATPSSPAIAGHRLIVTSKGGTVNALRLEDGSLIWQLRVGAPVESSPIVIDGTVYVGAADGRLFALSAASGKPRWAYDLGSTINASPTIVGPNVCIATYGGAVGCFRRDTGVKVWVRYFKRDLLRYSSFYASPSSDGERLYAASRDGLILALNPWTGDTVWQVRTGGWTYGTPAVSGGRVFVADLDRTIRAFRADDGTLLWSRPTGGRVLAPVLVVGNLVFYSTLEGRTVALWAPTGDERWRFRAGKYSPGIATAEHYYFSLNGLLVAFTGSNSQDAVRSTRRSGGSSR